MAIKPLETIRTKLPISDMNGGWDRISVLLMGIFVAVLLAGVELNYLAYIHANPPVVFHNRPLTLEKDAYYPGETAFLVADTSRFTLAPVTIYKTFVGSGGLFEAEPRVSRGANMGREENRLPVMIPEWLPPGNYVIQWKFVYQVNFIGVRIVEEVSAPFTVMEPPPG